MKACLDGILPILKYLFLERVKNRIPKSGLKNDGRWALMGIFALKSETV